MRLLLPGGLITPPDSAHPRVQNQSMPLSNCAIVSIASFIAAFVGWKPPPANLGGKPNFSDKSYACTLSFDTVATAAGYQWAVGGCVAAADELALLSRIRIQGAARIMYIGRVSAEVLFAHCRVSGGSMPMQTRTAMAGCLL